MAVKIDAIKKGDEAAVAERDKENESAKKTNRKLIKNLFDGLEKPGDGVKALEGVDLRGPDKPAYREDLTPNERKEKGLLIKVLSRYASNFDQLKSKSTVPAKLRRQTLAQLREYFDPELGGYWMNLQELYTARTDENAEATDEQIDSVFAEIHEKLADMCDAEFDYDIMVRIEDEYMEKSP